MGHRQIVVTARAVPVAVEGWQQGYLSCPTMFWGVMDQRGAPWKVSFGKFIGYEQAICVAIYYILK